MKRGSGMTTSELGLTVDALVDGAKASTYRLFGGRFPLDISLPKK